MKFAHMTNAIYDLCVRSVVMCYHRKRIYAIMSMSSVLSIIKLLSMQRVITMNLCVLVVGYMIVYKNHCRFYIELR